MYHIRHIITVYKLYYYNIDIHKLKVNAHILFLVPKIILCKWFNKEYDTKNFILIIKKNKTTIFEHIILNLNY